LKILFVVGSFPLLSETFILNQITGLLRRGHDVHIHALSRAEAGVVHPDVAAHRLLERTTFAHDLPRSRLLRPLEAVRLAAGSLRARNVPALAKTLDVFRFGQRALSLRLLYDALPLLGSPPYDVIHCHFGMNGVRGVALRAAGVLEGRIVTSFHGGDVNKNREGRRRQYEPLFRDCDLFTTNTVYTMERAESLGCPREKIALLPVGVDLSRYRPDEGGDIRTGGEILLTVGRLVEKKGHAYSIRAFARVLESHPDLHYRIAGEGPLRGELESQARELGIAEHVDFLGGVTQDQVPELLAECDVFVLPSVTAADGDREGQALVLQEAQAMMKPVVSTLHNGIPEGVRDSETGFLVPEKDPDALAEKLIFLLDHPATRREMGRRGRRLVESQFDIEKLNDRLVELYTRLLERP
jgi:colanic acid/amylovoran biosynthesis glycosyltransferase